MWARRAPGARSRRRYEGTLSASNLAGAAATLDLLERLARAAARAGRAARARSAVAVFLASTLALAAPAARAGTEEFSTFDVAAPEGDDESLLDHVLTRPPRPWRDEWEHASQALRTSQGCLTSGQWFIDTDMKLHSPLGSRARLGIDLRQSESDAASYDYLDFSFRFPTAIGTPGAMFRPLYDKSRQDFAFTWDTAPDTAALGARLTFTFEDMFNNLWAWRQTRVGEASEPYERHPYEPALRLFGRGDRWRAEVYGQYLTPSRKRVLGYTYSMPERLATLWGTLGFASIEARALGLTWEARGTNQQARSTDQPIDLSTGRHDNFRRQWTAEAAVRRDLTPRLSAEARAIYQSRTEVWGPPLGPSFFGGLDRLYQLDVLWSAMPRLSVRAGGLYDRIGIARAGPQPVFSWGTRNESRGYVGLLARFGRVSLEAIEGIELDPEPYEVWFWHDKGFFHLQTTF